MAKRVQGFQAHAQSQSREGFEFLQDQAAKQLSVIDLVSGRAEGERSRHQELQTVCQKGLEEDDLCSQRFRRPFLKAPRANATARTFQRLTFTSQGVPLAADIGSGLRERKWMASWKRSVFVQ